MPKTFKRICGVGMIRISKLMTYIKTQLVCWLMQKL